MRFLDMLAKQCALVIILLVTTVSPSFAEDFELSIHFEKRNAAPPDSTFGLAKLAVDRATKCNARKIHFIGHTGTEGAAADNLELSKARVDYISGIFIQYGADSSIFVLDPRGESEARKANPNDPAQVRIFEALNNRVDIKVSCSA